MNNKKIVLIVTVFIITLLIIIGIIALAEHILFLGKPIVFSFAIILVIFTMGFFAVVIRRKNK
ncbi:MAG: hypothetical protein NC213_08450 [Acetobacter sp.]|nr:hypothetical protein [Bacteroides sp.]MCM1341758.1 hypothetical protein [Acetobacter sp.]MCM1433101.1 hypothetical protein [Clostridiales bacterium]